MKSSDTVENSDHVIIVIGKDGEKTRHFSLFVSSVRFDSTFFFRFPGEGSFEKFRLKNAIRMDLRDLQIIFFQLLPKMESYCILGHFF